MDNKKCVVCDKPYDYKYNMFGRKCLDNMYDLLNINKPSRFFLNREAYLSRMIALKNHKFFLNQQKKEKLTQKYIALTYLEKMNFEILDEIKRNIKKDIKSISAFSKLYTETVEVNLHEIYTLYNYTKKFNEIIEKIKNVNWKKIDEKIAKSYTDNLAFIFDAQKKNDPISYVVFYAMQCEFWNIVVVGGLLTSKKFSAKLLDNSISILGQTPKDIFIVNDDEITQKFKNDAIFKERINLLIQKYGEGDVFFTDENSSKDEINIAFENSDLLYALHIVTMFVKAQKNENNNWDIDVEIKDTYDYTDFKCLGEYVDGRDKITDIFSSTLNNFGVVSSEYGVLKPYNVNIKFKLYDWK